MKPFFIVITGPTGVGKTDFISQLESALSTPISIINGDMGQMYSPISIGTAKPDWKSQTTPHYLFDVIDEPVSYTVTQYNQKVNDCLIECWKQNRLPIIVGGSGFYLKSLFYPPLNPEIDISQKFSQDYPGIDVDLSKENKELWEILNKIDPERAAVIDRNDIYRIERALDLWYKTGKLPSSFKPIYNPPAQYLVFFLTRDINDLYNRINNRVLCMLNSGWIEEVENLSQEWKLFLEQKKLIGYAEVIAFLKKECNIPKDKLISTISVKTRNYAKRQITFWKSFSKLLKSSNIYEIDLGVNLEICVMDLVKKIKNIYDNKII